MNSLSGEFTVIELTIQQAHQAIREGVITCQSLAAQYLDRIAKFDRELHCVARINADNVLARARELDEEFARTGKLRRLHGIPVIVMDNVETVGFPTTGGSNMLLDNFPDANALIIESIVNAGAVILFKSNMAEWAFSGVQTQSNVVAEETRNPYDLNRVPAGSSGGTASAISANLGLIGIGSDTGNSNRGPSSHCGLVGIRATMGLVSRRGLIPMSYSRDMAGPMCRTVRDAATLLQIISGPDPADPVTVVESNARAAQNFLKADLTSLDEFALRGATLGVFGKYINREGSDQEVNDQFHKSLQLIRNQGSVVVDGIGIDNFDQLFVAASGGDFGYDLNQYLASKDGKINMKNSSSILEDSKNYHPKTLEDLEYHFDPSRPDSRRGNSHHAWADPGKTALRESILAVMEANNLDAIIYPTWSRLPRVLGDIDNNSGDNSRELSPHSGLPAITVPMGQVNGLPTGISFLGKAFGEERLINICYSFEQASKCRIPPRKYL